MNERSGEYTNNREWVHALVGQASQSSWEKFSRDVILEVIDYAQKDPLADKPRKRIEFSAAEKEYLYILGHHLYLINGMIDGGSDNFALARKVFGYGIAEIEAGHCLEFDVTRPITRDQFEAMSAKIDLTFGEQKYLQDVLKTRNSWFEYYRMHETRKDIALRRDRMTDDLNTITEVGLYRTAREMVFGAACKPVIQEAKSFELGEWEMTQLAFQYFENRLDDNLVAALEKRRAWSKLGILMADHFMQGGMRDAYLMAVTELNTLAGGRNYGERWKLGTEGLFKKFYPESDITVIGGESANVKGVRSFLEKAVSDKEIFDEAELWARLLAAEGKTEIQEDVLRHPRHYKAALRERLIAIDELIKEQPVRAQDFLNRIKEKMRKTADVIRSRIVIPDGQLDAFCRKQIVPTNPEAYLVLSKRKTASLDRGTISIKEYFNLTDIPEGEIEEFVKSWIFQARSEDFQLTFAAVHDNRKIEGVPCQMEIATVSETGANIEARSFYAGWQ